MKKLLSLSLMLSLGLATVTPALNAVAESQQDTVAQSQANPSHVSGWQAAKKWWRSGRNMKALNRQEQRAFRALKRQFAIGTIITAIVALVGGGAAYLHRKSAGGAAAPVVAGHLGQELINAAERGDEAEVARLIAIGADVNAADENRWTALMQAAMGGNINIIKRLLKAGANVNVIDPLGYAYAVIPGHVDTYVFAGGTALMCAAQAGNADIVRLLLNAGADKDIQSRDGETAESLARNDKIAKMIRDYEYKLPPGRRTKRAKEEDK